MPKVAEARINGNICSYSFEDGMGYKIEELLKAFDKDEGLVKYETEDELSEEEYIEAAEEFKRHYITMTTVDYAKTALNNYPLKKNGTFYKGRIYSSVMMNACGFFQEWHNTWTYPRLTVKAISDTELVLTLDNVTDTPG